MTIEELKARYQKAALNPGHGTTITIQEAMFAGPWCMLAPEIMALVEAVEADRDDIGPHTEAMLDAFSAKLEAL